jgi:hypothetical protein
MSNHFPHAGRQFLAASTRNLQAVYQKLHTLLAWDQHPMEPFFQVEDAMVAAGVGLPRTAVQDAMTYVSNSWSSTGEGLFFSDRAKNLNTAVDLAITQTLLPFAADDFYRSPSLYDSLASVLDSQYPHSMIMLNDLVGR